MLLRVQGTGPRVTYVTATYDHAFRRGVDNQGWWSNKVANADGNDNYLVGYCCGNGSHRAFWTFDLSRLPGTPIVAILELQRFRGRGTAPTHTLALYDVSTPPKVLNRNNRLDLGIYRDLGTGDRYGLFHPVVSGPPTSLVRLRLNDTALGAITASRGGLFSIGASLLTRPGFLFADSDGRGVQRLLVRTECDMRGTAGPDQMTGTAGNDFMCGFRGADRISAGRGFDVVGGGRGDDSVTGGLGNDTVNLGDGRDVARGGSGDDKLNGGRGNDLLFGGKGDDILRGRGGADLIAGGAGHDTCYTKPGDVVRGCEDVR